MCIVNFLTGNPDCDLGGVRIQKMVIQSPTQDMDSKTDGRDGLVIVALHCGESVIN